MAVSWYDGNYIGESSSRSSHFLGGWMTGWGGGNGVMGEQMSTQGSNACIYIA